MRRITSSTPSSSFQKAPLSLKITYRDTIMTLWNTLKSLIKKQLSCKNKSNRKRKVMILLCHQGVAEWWRRRPSWGRARDHWLITMRCRPIPRCWNMMSYIIWARFSMGLCRGSSWECPGRASMRPPRRSGRTSLGSRTSSSSTCPSCRASWLPSSWRCAVCSRKCGSSQEPSWSGRGRTKMDASIWLPRVKCS